MNPDEESSVGRLRSDSSGVGGNAIDIPGPSIGEIVKDKGPVMDLSYNGCDATAAGAATQEAANLTTG